MVGDAVGEKGDPVGRDELQEDGESDGENAADDGARKGRDLGELVRQRRGVMVVSKVGRRSKERSSECAKKERAGKGNGSAHASLRYTSRALTSSMAVALGSDTFEMTMETKVRGWRGSRAKFLGPCASPQLQSERKRKRVAKTSMHAARGG